MERVFWVTCPDCGDKHYCDYELRHKEIKLICPFCGKEFFDRESPEIDERW